MIDFDEHLSIEANFSGQFESGFIALHPFYKKVFHEEFDYRRRLRDTYHLIEPVTWSKVMTELSFKSVNQLAKALVKPDTPDARELNEFVAFRRLLFPVMEQDTIPEVLLHNYLEFLLKQGAKELVCGYSRHTILEEHRRNTSIGVDHQNIYDVIEQLHNRFVVNGGAVNINLLLPDHDCPYTLVLGDKGLVSAFTSDFGIEGFWVNKSTKFDWWED